MERNYWLHRIKGGDNALPFSYPLLFNHNWLSIGWSDLSEDSFVEQVRAKGLKVIEDALRYKDGHLPRNRLFLYRFLCEMKKGDYVIVPTQGEFSIYEILDDIVLTNESIDKSIYIDWDGNKAKFDKDGYMKNSQNHYIDLGFYRLVKPITLHISRSDFADSDLQRRMKIQQTNADINDLKDSVEQAKLRFEQHSPVNLKEEITGEAARILLDKIHRFTNPDKLEELVEWYLKSIGANEVIKPSKNESSIEEGDADRIAIFEDIKTRIMVQVKKHDKGTDTNEWAVQQIDAYSSNHNLDEYYNQMWVISTCDNFNDKAINLSRTQNVRLINGIEFCRMILDAGLEGLNL